MLHEYPDYLDEFECIGGRCTDTCCSGWEFDIDPETARIYSEIPGEEGEYIRSRLTYAEDGSLCISPGEGGRCPFLNENNLCELILKHGDNILSDACAEYPRYYTDIGNYEAIDMSLSCMELGRLFFTRDGRPTVYRKVDDDIEGEILPEEEEKNLRKRINERDGMIREIYSQSETLFLNDAGFTKSEEDEMLFSLFDDLDYYHYLFGEFVKSFRASLPELQERSDEFFLGRKEDILRWFRYLSEYFVFRYTISDLAAGVPIEATMRFVKRSLRLIYLASCFEWLKKGEFEVDNMIYVAHVYSKEIEHNLKNVSIIRG